MSNATYTPESPVEGSDLQHQQPSYVERYGLFTAICMIVGICVGSGIFFKADNVLIATQGDMLLGVLMFVIAAFAIVFGGLSLSVFAEKHVAAGGIIAYARECMPKRLATVFAWNYAFLYLVPIAAVVSWVVGVFACPIFNLDDTLEMQSIIGLVFMTACIVWNICWPRLSGWLQNASTAIKMIPLVVVGVVGIATTLYLMVTGGDVAHLEATTHAPAHTGSGFAWLAAAAPIAFSYDGWSIATSIAPEIKNSKKNLAFALVIAPLVVLGLYVAYFLGLSLYLGPQTVIETGDLSSALMLQRLFGDWAAQIPLVMALIAVAGTANGVILAALRMPYALAEAGDLPYAKRVATMHPSLKFPVVSGLVSAACMYAIFALHYVLTRVNFIPNGDVSEISVLMTMVFFIPLYVGALRVYKKGDGVFKGVVSPLIAIVVCAFVSLSGLLSEGRLQFAFIFVVVLAVVYCLFVWHDRRAERLSGASTVPHEA